IAKSPIDRYATAEALAADVRRFLEHQAILAKPPSLRKRLRQFCRQHRFGVAASTAAVIAMVGGATMGAVHAQHRFLDDLLEPARLLAQQPGWEHPSSLAPTSDIARVKSRLDAALAQGESPSRWRDLDVRLDAWCRSKETSLQHDLQTCLAGS